MSDKEQIENKKLKDENNLEENQGVNIENNTNINKAEPAQISATSTSSPIEPLEKTDFEPKIIGFLCNWCSYAGADLCGVSRYQYPTNVRVIRVMCSTRIDPNIIFEMFIQGADGVLVGGCHLGDCHYISGNFHTERKIKLTKRLMKEAGMDTRRLKLEWISASEGERFSKVITEFTNEIKGLGQSPLAGENPDIDLLEALFAARNVAKDFRVRALVGRELGLTEKGNVYNEKIPQDKLDKLYDDILKDEFLRHRILQLTKNRPLSVKDIAKYVNFTPKSVLKQIVTLKDRGLILLDRIDGTSPLYVSKKVEISDLKSGL